MPLAYKAEMRKVRGDSRAWNDSWSDSNRFRSAVELKVSAERATELLRLSINGSNSSRDNLFCFFDSMVFYPRSGRRYVSLAVE